MADPKTIVRRFVEEIMVRRDLEVLEELVHADYRRLDRFTPEASREELRRNLLDTKTSWNDREVSIEQMIAEGEQVVVVLKARGRLSGTYKGIDPTHRVHESQGIAIVTLRDEKIAHVSTHWDYLSLFEQVGFTLSSTASQNKVTALRFVTDVIIDRNADAARELAHEDFVRHDSFRPIEGRDALVAALEEQAWDAGHLTVRRVIAEGDEVAVHLSGGGIHADSFNGIPASGADASSSGLAFLKVKGGKVAEVSSYWDYTGLISQIGGGVSRIA